MHRRFVALLATLLLGALAVAVPLRAEAEGDPRVRQLHFAVETLGAVHVNVLLPSGYHDPANAGRRYPVLYLLHGASGDSGDWLDNTDIEELTAGEDLIVVMPDGGAIGFYSDWADGGPQWESFHIGRLLPHIDASFRTDPRRQARAIAGLSMGGFGSTHYATRYPDLFGAVASFSGATDIADLHVVGALGFDLLTLRGRERWGPFVGEEITWRDHNPADLTSNLRWTAVDLYAGNGVPRAGDNPAAAPVEGATYAMSNGLHLRLQREGIPHGWHDYGAGTHEWHYWQADLHDWLPRLLAAFDAPPPPPAAWDYRTARPAFSVWDWSFTVHRDVAEFLDLTGVSPSGLTARGSGGVDVVTAPSYVPGAAYQVDATGGQGAITVGDVLATVRSGPAPGGSELRASSATVIAGPDGRLRFPVDLGPSHRHEQFTAAGTLDEALAPATYWGVTSVRIGPA